VRLNGISWSTLARDIFRQESSSLHAWTCFSKTIPSRNPSPSNYRGSFIHNRYLRWVIKLSPLSRTCILARCCLSNLVVYTSWRPRLPCRILRVRRVCRWNCSFTSDAHWWTFWWREFSILVSRGLLIQYNSRSCVYCSYKTVRTTRSSDCRKFCETVFQQSWSCVYCSYKTVRTSDCQKFCETVFVQQAAVHAVFNRCSTFSVQKQRKAVHNRQFWIARTFARNSYCTRWLLACTFSILGYCSYSYINVPCVQCRKFCEASVQAVQFSIGVQCCQFSSQSAVWARWSTLGIERAWHFSLFVPSVAFSPLTMLSQFLMKVQLLVRVNSVNWYVFLSAARHKFCVRLCSVPLDFKFKFKTVLYILVRKGLTEPPRSIVILLILVVFFSLVQRWSD